MFFYSFNIKTLKIYEKWLIIPIFILAFNSFDNGLYLSGKYKNYPHILMVSAILFFIYWPLVYIFFESSSKKDFKPGKKHILLFLPFLYYLINWFPFFIKSGKEKLAFMALHGASNDIFSRIIGYFFMFYIIYSSVRFYKSKESHNIVEKVFLYFNVFLSFSSLTYYIFFLLIYKFNFNIHKLIGFILYQIIFVAPSFFLIYLFYKEYKDFKRETFFEKNNFESNVEEKNESKDFYDKTEKEVFKNEEYGDVEILEARREKYKMNKISKEDAEEYFKRIKQYVEENKSYKDNKFNLTKLSKELKIPQAYISQTLNIYQNETFYGFLNKYRIEEAKKLLIRHDYQNKTILSIAYESGFNSKATFNNSFKKNVGMTPSEYRKKFKNQQN